MSQQLSFYFQCVPDLEDILLLVFEAFSLQYREFAVD